jgi:hypothetical protein
MSDVRDKVLAKLRTAIAAGAVLAAGDCTRCSSPYGVVDPMPPPSRCGYGGVIDGILGSVTVDESGGVRTLKLVVTLKGDSNYTFAAALDVDGGQLIGIQARPRSITAKVNVAADPKPISIRVPVSCEDTPGSGLPRTATLVATINEPAAPHPEVTFVQEP